MRKHAKHLLSLAMILVLLCAAMVMPAMAEETTEPTYVAQIGENKYETLTAAVEAAQAGDTVTVIADHELTGTIVVDKDIILDLNGKTITNVGGTSNHTFRVAANMTVKNGTINNTAGGYCFIVGYNTPQAGNLTIESGSYYGNTTVISVTYGSVEIKNGYFEATPYNDNQEFTFNCVDRFYTAGNATITVYGGTFANFNPANNASEGDNTNFMAADHISVDNGDGTYTVSKIEVAEVNGTTYPTLQAAVAAADEGSTVYLLKSTEGSGIVIDKDVTIDFGGFTYSFTEPAVGSNGTESNGFQILSGNTVTLQNGTLNVAKGYENQYYILIQNYADLTVSNMTLDGTNLDKYSATDGDSYVLSNNCGTVNITDTIITANDAGTLAYAFDACKYASYAAPTVTATNCTVTGMVDVCGGTLIVDGGTYKPTSQCTDAFIVSSGSLTIGGEVTVTGGTLDGSTAIWAKENGNVTINSGTYTITEPVSADVEQGYNDLIYAKDKAVVTINGGHFSGPARTSDNQRFLLNLKDNCAATFTVKGGTFISFNPADTGTEPAGVNDNFLAEGYCVNKNGTTYTVCTHKLISVEAKPATCVATGIIAHYTCESCGTLYNDPAGLSEITQQQATQNINPNAHSYYEDLYPGEDYHCKKCELCGYEADKEAHGEFVVDPEDMSSMISANECVTFYVKQCPVCGKDGSYEDLVAVPLENPAHAWDEGTVTTAATCTTTGVKTYTCTTKGCTATKTETVPVIAHTEVTVPGKTATCTETGLTEGKKCSVCGITTVAQDTIPANNHKGGEATCNNGAVCEVCGKEYGTGMGHTLSLVEAKAPTCTEAGIMEHALCKNCGKTFTNDENCDELTTVTIPANGHTEVVVTGKAATCTETGLTDGKKCSVCGTVTVAQETINKVAHTEVTVPGKAATCTETGLTDGKKCSVCGTVTVAQETIAALGHKLETVKATEATYFAAGNIEHSKCTVCAKLFDAEGKELDAADVVIAQLVKVEENKAEVSTGVVDNAVKEAETTGSVNIVINVTKDEMAKEDTTPDDSTTTPDSGVTEPTPAPVVTKTELPVASVEQVAEIHEEATLTVTMTNATVTMDKTTLEVVAEAAKTEGTEVISLEIEHIEAETLAPAQQEAIENKEVAAVISASILVNDTEVHDFKGGNVTVAIPFTPAEGTKGSDYVVLYIADDGSVEEIPTAYENGVLTMTLEHFSEYVVVNTNVKVTPPTDPDMPTTGDNTNMMMYATVMVLSLAAAVAILSKKNFLA